MQAEHAITEWCDALAVARSGYHAWAARVPGPRAQANATLWPLIEQAYAESRQTQRRFRVALTDSNHDSAHRTQPPAGHHAPNPGRDAVWVADITYVDTEEGWLYVAGCGLGHE